MAREWAVVFDTLSSRTARSLGHGLREEVIEVDVDAGDARVWAFADDEQGAFNTRDAAIRVAERLSEPTLQGPPMVRRWNEQQHRYVDPDAPDEDPDTRDVWIESEIAPDEVMWQVRLTLVSVFDFRRVRRQLPQLRRPVITTGNRHIDLGARDLADAGQIAARASRLGGVANVEPTAIRGRMRRWLVRQRLAGNYGTAFDGSSPGYGYADFGGGGGAGDGGGGGHGGHGGGGHGGH